MEAESSSRIRRRNVLIDNVDSDDENWVDASIPSTPLELDGGKPDFDVGHFDDREDPSTIVPRTEIPSDPEDGARWEDAEPVHEEDVTDDRQCRICFGGPEEEDCLGRLISPCFCTGSLRYVHVKCINAWRGTGTNAKAFMECPQCNHQYRLRRTLVSGLATSGPILLVLSTALFFVLTTLTGALLHYLLVNSSSTRRRLLTASTIFDTEASDGLNTWTSDGGDTFIVVGIGSSLMWDVIVSSIQTFTRIALEFADLTEDLAQGWIGGLLFDIGIRFILGLAILGSFSFMTLLFSVSLFGPFHIFNTLRGIGMFRSWTRGRGEGGRGGRSGFGQAMIVVFVLIGTVNTLWSVYRAVNGITQRILVYVEAQILEVNPEMRQKEKEKREKRRREGWLRRWARAGGWKTGWGWWELVVRATYALIGVVKHRYQVAREGWNRGWDF